MIRMANRIPFFRHIAHSGASASVVVWLNPSFQSSAVSQSGRVAGKNHVVDEARLADSRGYRDHDRTADHLYSLERFSVNRFDIFDFQVRHALQYGACGT